MAKRNIKSDLASILSNSGKGAKGYGNESSVNIDSAKVQDRQIKQIKALIQRIKTEQNLIDSRNHGAGTQTRKICANNLNSLAVFAGSGGGRTVGA